MSRENNEVRERDFRVLEKRFLADAKAHLDECADRRLAEINSYQSRFAYDREKLHEAYFALLKAKYDSHEDDEYESKMRRDLADLQSGDDCPF